ncbi:MAG: bifunctional nuclease family protein [Candidatus Obscuribacterales bacterium]
MFEMLFAGVFVDISMGQPILLLADEPRSQALPILVGIAEANAVAHGFTRRDPSRPMTHDLLSQTIDRLGYRLREVQLRNDEDELLHASIILCPAVSSRERSLPVEERPFSMEARPSDAIALATRLNSPIYVTRGLMAECGFALRRRAGATHINAVQQWLEESRMSESLREAPGLADENGGY